LKKIVKNSARTSTPTSDPLLAVIAAGIRKGTIKLSGFERLVYEAGKVAGAKITRKY
jgi:hypothetical protein